MLERFTLEHLNFGARLWLAFTLPWKVVFSGAFAARLNKLEETLALPAIDHEDQPAQSSSESESSNVNSDAEALEPEDSPRAALQLLAILQREGRFVDFLQEDMSGFSDDEIGAAARAVHEGCKRGLEQYIKLCPIRDEEEGAQITLEAGYDASETRITGNIVGEPPYAGTLAHHGWRAKEIELPTLSSEHDAHIVAPAEVEISA